MDVRLLAALGSPEVCGFHEPGGAPCDMCVDGIEYQLRNGVTVEQLLADIDWYRTDRDGWMAARQAEYAQKANQ